METTIDISTLLNKSDFSNEDFKSILESAFASADSLDRLIERARELERSASDGPAVLKVGLIKLVMGCPAEAAEILERAPASALRDFYRAAALADLRRFDEAIACFEAASRAGWDDPSCRARIAECQMLAGNLDAAARAIDAIPAAAQSSAEVRYARGRLHQERGDLDAAMAEYEAAVTADDAHPRALFQFAYLLDLHGSDDRARELYYRCTELPFVYSHALMNLAVIQEDRAEYEKATACLRRVLAVDPNNARARLYLKDVLAAREMYIDEAQVQAREKRDQVLDIPVTDFELSVRSRNCLKKMNINTLGDLLRTSEAELLSYKNFGETSLREIRAMLAQKGLTLGQYANRPDVAAPPPAPPAPAPAAFPDADPEVLSRPVASLELSVRSRKCLLRLGINTVGELAARSEAELLDSRNFGQTSLKEIKNRLAELGFALR